MKAKPAAQLTAEDLTQYPVWEFDNGDEALPGRDETWVVPVAALPVSSLSNRLVAATIQIGDRQASGLLGNVDLGDVEATREFATLSVYRGGAWVHLARYFDADYQRHGPEQFAACLGLSPLELFPIRYDISAVATGHPDVVRGQFDIEPARRLTDDERLDLIFGRLDRFA